METLIDIETDEVRNDLPIEGLMMFEETSSALDFLKDEKEDVYTVDDLKVRYQSTIPTDYRYGNYKEGDYISMEKCETIDF